MLWVGGVGEVTSAELVNSWEVCMGRSFILHLPTSHYTRDSGVLFISRETTTAWYDLFWLSST